MRIVTHHGASADATNVGGAGISIDLPSNGQGSDTKLIFETLPADVWRVVSPSVVSDPLSRGIKRAYDPHNILNPGILGD